MLFYRRGTQCFIWAENTFHLFQHCIRVIFVLFLHFLHVALLFIFPAPTSISFGDIFPEQKKGVLSHNTKRCVFIQPQCIASLLNKRKLNNQQWIFSSLKYVLFKDRIYIAFRWNLIKSIAMCLLGIPILFRLLCRVISYRQHSRI